MHALLLAMLAVGPVLDPMEGEVLLAADRDLLATGRHIGDVADHLFLIVDSMQNPGGSMALFDRLYVSSHGRSWSQQHFMLNDFEITDPARPGSPLVQIPHDAWQALEYRSLWTDRPGFTWRVDPRLGSAGVRAAAVGGAGVGGGEWIPPGVFDREPATRSGSPPERRSLAGAFEVSAQASLGPEPFSARVDAEHLVRRHRYPLTLIGTDGRSLVDRAERTTGIAAAAWKLGALPFEATGVWQRSSRSHEGAQFRWPLPLTGDEHGNAAVAQIGTRGRPWGDWAFSAGLGLGWRDDTFERHDGGPIVSDIEGEWMWQQRPRLTERVGRTRIDADLRARHTPRLGAVELGTLKLGLRGSWSRIVSRPRGRSKHVSARTWDRGPASDRAVSMIIFDPPRRTVESVSGGVARVDWELEVRGSVVRVTAGLDVGSVSGGGMLHESIAPAVGVAARIPLG
ncbi:MAG: hypothetical protein V3T05_00720, partial [Myxococcota bacterium]